MALVILIIYAVSIGFIFLYSLIQLSLIVSYLRSKSKKKEEITELLPSEYPLVTIQLPVYNELYVVERLIECICNFDYPKDKLEIQVLDDSTDETVELIAQRVHFYQLEGFDIKQVRRKERTGFKAGALKYGTEICKGEFIAIFDADFLPSPDFLKKTLPHFKDEKVGLVQTKWSYTNSDYSFLTQIQAFGLNAHFTIEQVGREYNNHFINFNGTAGIWRKKAIETSGGWQPDTLTEDLDLSYRAQLNDWKFKYLEEVDSPSELPVEINALKTQQFRWTKGAAECVRKSLWKVISSGKSFRTKVHATFHLMNSSVFIFIFLLTALSLPLIMIKPLYEEYKFIFQLSMVFAVSWVILGFFYWVSFTYGRENKWQLLKEFVWKFPVFLAVSMGLSLHNAIAVFEGYIGKKSPFVRTPKFNINSKKDQWEGNKYNIKKIGLMTYLEGGFLLYILQSIYVSIVYKDFGILPFLIFLAIGYSIVFINSLFHWNRAAKSYRYDHQVS
ncbi:MAG: glycosyltransferase family 2 protein [Flavobacteriales bacterium]|nr:glycosyltransferase family 2 protein [Flavobacteriales bacterium]